ncbi:hypothetical protein BC937DRAFT_94105 [Endogone sp. FLAS-F59071]|nr:hypothetical protein BC937DRAFT_94105 [Endogone sp. FLAS-F59071]|eukprot:RUS22986.1 hypothetical protein BC937DRAFT_94105 [Endogone sp. FLAS-F59071]
MLKFPTYSLAHLRPLPRCLQNLQQILLPTPARRLMHVLPPGVQRQTHEDALYPASRGLQPELGPAIPDQVEFNIPPAAQLLPSLHLLSKGHVFAAFEDGNVRKQERVAHVLNKREELFRRPVIQIIKKDTTDTTGLVAVLDKEIIVAPLLEFGIIFLVVLIARSLERLVEVDCVLVKQV